MTDKFESFNSSLYATLRVTDLSEKYFDMFGETEDTNPFDTNMQIPFQIPLSHRFICNALFIYSERLIQATLFVGSFGGTQYKLQGNNLFSIAPIEILGGLNFAWRIYTEHYQEITICMLGTMHIKRKLTEG